MRETNKKRLKQTSNNLASRGTIRGGGSLLKNPMGIDRVALCRAAAAGMVNDFAFIARENPAAGAGLLGLLVPQSVDRGHGTALAAEPSRAWGGKRGGGRHPHFSDMSPTFRRVAISISIHFRAQPMRSGTLCQKCAVYFYNLNEGLDVGRARPRRSPSSEGRGRNHGTRDFGAEASTGTVSAFHQHFLFLFLIPTEKRTETDGRAGGMVSLSPSFPNL